MTIATTAISFILLASGLATCGWRFFDALRGGVSGTGETVVGRLLASLFLLSAGYNGILGISSLLLVNDSAGALWLIVAGHVTLTALAILSVYTVYYIFCPETPPRALLSTISVMGGVGLFHINTPLQLAPLLTGNFNPGLLVITISLLTVSLGAMLFLFIQLYRKAQTRSIKILSAAVCGLTLASAANIAIQIGTPYWQFGGTGLAIMEIILGLIGAGFLLGTIATPALRWSTVIVGIFLIWWTLLYIKFNGDTNFINTSVWPDVYNLMAIWGVWWGFKATQRFGGIKKILGRTTAFFTLGLLLQSFGQITFSIYFNFFGIEVPYPSLADIAYLGSPILYLIGLATLSRTLGVTQNLNNMRRGPIILLTSLGILIFSGLAIGLGTTYVFDWNEPLRIVLDLAYPLVEGLCLMLIFSILLNQTIYLQLNRTLLMVGVALFTQYSADMLFTYLAANELWHGGSPGELLYLIAYFLMASALIGFHQANIGNVPAISATKKEVGLPFAPTNTPLANRGFRGSFAEVLRMLTATFYDRRTSGMQSNLDTKKT